MLSPITESELDFLSMYFHPTSLTENLVPENINAAHNWPHCPTVYVRPYQYTMQNYSYLYANDPKKSKEENFRIKKMVGDCYMIGARNLGKSYFLIIDCILSIIHNIPEIAVGSFDDRHLQKVTNPIALFIERHKFLQIFHLKDTRKDSVNRGTNFEIMTEHGSLTKGVNEKVGEVNAGEQYHGLHAFLKLYEEYSYASTEGQLKGVDAVSSLGCIERPSGIPDLNIGSPLGKILQDKKLKPWIWRYPQFARCDWTEKTEQEKNELYGGKNSVSYKLNVEAEITEGAFGYFDMVRLKEASLDKTRLIKFFEVGKESFGNFEQSLIIERLPGAEQCFICADLGFGAAPTETIIIFFDGKKYKWVYNISLFRLSPEEQPDVFYWLYNKLGGAFIALDSSIHPDEFILLKIDNNIKYIRFKDIEQFKESLLEVPTYNNDKLEWKKAKLIKHYYKGKMGEIILSPGNSSVKVTDNHSVMIYDNDGLKTKFLSDCKSGEWMLCPKHYKIRNVEYKILNYKLKKVNHHVKDEYRDIKLDEELAYFLGWCCAEGSSKTYSYQLSLGDEQKYAEELLELYRKLFKTKHGYIQKISAEYRNSKTYSNKIARSDIYQVVLSGGKGSVEFFENLLGKGSHNKKIPEVIFNSPETVQREFIRGFLLGDGHSREMFNNVKINIGVASEELAKGLSCLLNILGERTCYTVYKDKKLGLISYKLDWYINSKNDEWSGIPYKILNINNKSHRVNSKTNNFEGLLKKYPTRITIHDKFKKLKFGDWEFRKIKKINYENYEGFVYDLEVEDNHTFVAGHGNILVHNTSDSGAMIERLAKKGIPRNHLLAVRFTENMEVGFEKDENNQVICDSNGEPITKKTGVEQFSFQELERLFYNGQMSIPPDEKFLSQATNVICKQTKTRPLFDCKIENHLIQSFQCFSVCRFYNEWVGLKNCSQKKRGWLS